MSKWTDEQAADAAIALLKPPHEITVMQSWFKPVPSAFGGHEAGPGRWVPVKEHADIVLTLGRRILDLEAELDAMRPVVERAYQWRDSDPNDRDYHPLVAAVDEHRAQREGK